jgi:hypothetical protein
MALAPAMAFGTEKSPPLPIVGQTNSAPANATAGNANTSGQLIGQSGGGSQSADQTAVNTQVVPIAAAPATSVQTLPLNVNAPLRFLDELPRLPVDPFDVLADPVKTVGGAIPADPFALLASPTDALGALPLATVTGPLGGLPLGTVTGLCPILATGPATPPPPRGRRRARARRTSPARRRPVRR